MVNKDEYIDCFRCIILARYSRVYLKSVVVILFLYISVFFMAAVRTGLPMGMGMDYGNRDDRILTGLSTGTISRGTRENGVPIVKVFTNTLWTALQTIFRPQISQIA